MIAALRRVLTMPGWVAGVWVLSVALAAGVGAVVAAAVDGALDGHAVLADGRILFSIADLGLDHRALASTAVAGLGLTTVAGAVAWAFLVGPVIARLTMDAPAAIARGWARLPGVLAQSSWHVLLRVVLLMLAMSTASALPWGLGWPLLVVAWILGVVALDVARVRVVLGDAPPWHPKTAVTALVDSVRTPGRYWRAWSLALVSTLLPLVITLVALANLGATMMPTYARALSLLGVVLGLWRLSVVVDAAAPAAPAAGDD